MKISSKDLYRILNKELKTIFQAEGFKRNKSGLLSWHKCHGSLFFVVWFQSDRYGWFDEAGSRFTFEFQIAPHTFTGSSTEYPNSEKSRRFSFLLSETELESVRKLNNKVIEKIPIGPEGERLFNYCPSSEPINPSHDPWLHFFEEEDIHTWTEFFTPILPSMLKRFSDRLERQEWWKPFSTNP